MGTSPGSGNRSTRSHDLGRSAAAEGISPNSRHRHGPEDRAAKTWTERPEQLDAQEPDPSDGRRCHRAGSGTRGRSPRSLAGSRDRVRPPSRLTMAAIELGVLVGSDIIVMGPLVFPQGYVGRSSQPSRRWPTPRTPARQEATRRVRYPCRILRCFSAMVTTALTLLTPDEVDRAEDEPGLYAWYATLVFGATDWQQRLDATTGHDLGMAAFGQLLASQTTRLTPPTIRVGAVGHLWARWAGQLDEGGTPEIKKAIAQTHASPSAGPSALRKIIQREDLRAATAEVLSTCAPRVSAPIYIGVATRLRARLRQHVAALREGIDAIAANGGMVPDDLRKSFGGRAAAAGFTEELLSVATVPIASDTLTVDDRRTIAEGAEFLLNRWARPILGRR